MKTAALLAVAALTAPALSAQTIDLPQRKAGLWEITTSYEKPMAMPAFTAQVCLDAATEKEMVKQGLQTPGINCKQMTVRREGKSVVIDADCTIDGMATKSKTVISGDFQSSYTVRSEGTADMEGFKDLEMLTTQTGTWKGADCPGMKPGDVLFGGVKINRKQISEEDKADGD
jgi:hypothetical protein